jgi:DNA-binding transcriptional regulator YiaG
MSLQTIRKRLQLTQAEIAAPLGVTQGSVSFYETGQTAVPPGVAAKLIEFAKGRGVEITYDDVYAPEPARAA